MANIANIFNDAWSGAGDHILLSGSTDGSWRIRQLNIQNKDTVLPTEITIKSGSKTVIGPITFDPKQLLNIELASEEHQHMLTLPKGDALTINSSANVSLIAFGFAGND